MSGGEGGSITFFGYNGMTNTANLTADGGDASGTEERAGCGGCSTYQEYDYGINLLSDNGPVDNSGTLSVSGGDATGNAGYGGDAEVVQIMGRTVKQPTKLVTAASSSSMART